MEYDRLASELFCSFGKITRYISRQKLEITKGEAFVLQELYKSKKARVSWPKNGIDSAG